LLHIYRYRRSQPRGFAKELAQALAHDPFRGRIQGIEARAKRGKFDRKIDSRQRAVG
jgi:hypothetical protein